MWTPTEVSNLVWAQVWQVTVVGLLVGLASHLLRVRHWHPAIANSLWLLVLAKALTPPLWASSLGIFSWDIAVATSMKQVEYSDEAITRSWSSNVSLTFVAVWLAGFCWTLAYHIYHWRKLQSLIRETAVSVHPGLEASVEKLAQQLKLKRSPPVVVTETELGPALAGLFHPVVILPQSLVQQATWAELEPIVAHELLHLRRRDTFVSAVQLIANAIWWFHPLVRWAGKQVEEASERCVDLAVLHVAGCDPATYCRSLLRVLESRCDSTHCLLIATPAVRGVSATCERVRELAKVSEKPKRWQRIASVGFVAALAIVTLPGRPVDALVEKQCLEPLIEYSHENDEIVFLVDRTEK